jgi:LIVCS family branched-chain amino acid:cation transporter
MKNQSKLPLKKIILLGCAMFSIHFGGSSMIWPMQWGKSSGNSVLLAFLGAFLTAVFFPLLGYVALSKGGGTFYDLSKCVSKSFANIFCTITILILGPLFAIPRMSAAAWDAFLQVINYSPKNIGILLLFSIIFYSVTYWFIAQKSKTIDKLSKILFPFLMITVIAIFIKGLLTPVSSMVIKSYSSSAFSFGFFEGYATIELPAALVCATIFINDLKAKGFSDNKLSKHLLTIGIVGMSLLAMTHLGHMLIGASTGELFSDLKYSALYAQVVMVLWGKVGGVLFNFALLFAALTSAIGLTAATADYFEERFKNKISFNVLAIVALIFSIVISLFGLSTIVIYTTPLFTLIYPAAITLTIFFAFFGKKINQNKTNQITFKYSVLIAFLWGIIEAGFMYLNLFGFDVELVSYVNSISPFTISKYTWIWIVLVGYLFSYIFFQIKFKMVNYRRIKI